MRLGTLGNGAFQCSGMDNFVNTPLGGFPNGDNREKAGEQGIKKDHTGEKRDSDFNLGPGGQVIALAQMREQPRVDLSGDDDDEALDPHPDIDQYRGEYHPADMIFPFQNENQQRQYKDQQGHAPEQQRIAAR